MTNRWFCRYRSTATCSIFCLKEGDLLLKDFVASLLSPWKSFWKIISKWIYCGCSSDVHALASEHSDVHSENFFVWQKLPINTVWFCDLQHQHNLKVLCRLSCQCFCFFCARHICLFTRLLGSKHYKSHILVHVNMCLRALNLLHYVQHASKIFQQVHFCLHTFFFCIDCLNTCNIPSYYITN